MKMQSEFLIHFGRCDCVGVLGVCPQYQFCYFLCKCSFDQEKNSVTVNSVKVDIIVLVKKDRNDILFTLIFIFFYSLRTKI
jgi:hypothetical protein